MKKLQLILFFVFPFTIYSQLTLKNNYYKTEDLISLRLSNTHMSSLDNFLMNLDNDSVRTDVTSDSIKYHWDFSTGIDSWYFIPLIAAELSINLSEQKFVSVQFASILLHNDFGVRIINKPTKNSGLFYGGGVHKTLNVLAGTGLFLGGIVGYEWVIFKSTRIGGEIRPGLFWSEGEGIDSNGDPWLFFGIRVRW